MFLQLWQTQTSFEQPSVFFTCWLGVGCQSNFGKEGSKRAGYLSSGSSPAFSCLQLIINVSFGVSYMLSPKLLQSHLTLCNPVDCSPPGFSVHGILQARILEWVAMPFSRGFCYFRPIRIQSQTNADFQPCFHLGLQAEN